MCEQKRGQRLLKGERFPLSQERVVCLQLEFHREFAKRTCIQFTDFSNNWQTFFCEFLSSLLVQPKQLMTDRGSVDYNAAHSLDSFFSFKLLARM